MSSRTTGSNLDRDFFLKVDGIIADRVSYFDSQTRFEYLASLIREAKQRNAYPRSILSIVSGLDQAFRPEWLARHIHDALQSRKYGSFQYQRVMPSFKGKYQRTSLRQADIWLECQEKGAEVAIRFEECRQKLKNLKHEKGKRRTKSAAKVQKMIKAEIVRRMRIPRHDTESLIRLKSRLFNKIFLSTSATFLVKEQHAHYQHAAVAVLSAHQLVLEKCSAEQNVEDELESFLEGYIEELTSPQKQGIYNAFASYKKAFSASEDDWEVWRVADLGPEKARGERAKESIHSVTPFALTGPVSIAFESQLRLLARFRRLQAVALSLNQRKCELETFEEEPNMVDFIYLPKWYEVLSLFTEYLPELKLGQRVTKVTKKFSEPAYNVYEDNSKNNSKDQDVDLSALNSNLSSSLLQNYPAELQAPSGSGVSSPSVGNIIPSMSAAAPGLAHLSRLDANLEDGRLQDQVSTMPMTQQNYSNAKYSAMQGNQQLETRRNEADALDVTKRQLGGGQNHTCDIGLSSDEQQFKKWTPAYNELQPESQFGQQKPQRAGKGNLEVIEKKKGNDVPKSFLSGKMPHQSQVLQNERVHPYASALYQILGREAQLQQSKLLGKSLKSPHSQHTGRNEKQQASKQQPTRQRAVSSNASEPRASRQGARSHSHQKQHHDTPSHILPGEVREPQHKEQSIPQPVINSFTPLNPTVPTQRHNLSSQEIAGTSTHPRQMFQRELALPSSVPESLQATLGASEPLHSAPAPGLPGRLFSDTGSPEIRHPAEKTTIQAHQEVLKQPRRATPGRKRSAQEQKCEVQRGSGPEMEQPALKLSQMATLDELLQLGQARPVTNLKGSIPEPETRDISRHEGLAEQLAALTSLAKLSASGGAGPPADSAESERKLRTQEVVRSADPDILRADVRPDTSAVQTASHFESNGNSVPTEKPATSQKKHTALPSRGEFSSLEDSFGKEAQPGPSFKDKAGAQLQTSERHPSKKGLAVSNEQPASRNEQAVSAGKEAAIEDYEGSAQQLEERGETGPDEKPTSPGPLPFPFPIDDLPLSTEPQLPQVSNLNDFFEKELCSVDNSAQLPAGLPGEDNNRVPQPEFNSGFLVAGSDEPALQPTSPSNPTGSVEDNHSELHSAPTAFAQGVDQSSAANADIVPSLTFDGEHASASPLVESSSPLNYGELACSNIEGHSPIQSEIEAEEFLNLDTASDTFGEQ